MHHRYGRSEGDGFVFVDSEPPPGSSPGTGNEDYFNYVYVPDPNAPGWWLGTPHLPTEGEDLQVVSANGPRPFAMDMLNEGPDWSGGKQLCQQARESGARPTPVLTCYI